MKHFIFIARVLLITCLFIPALRHCGHAQEKDAGLWLTGNIQKDITNNLRAVLTEELRFKENYSQLGSFFTNVSLQYKFSKSISASVNYRFINRRELNGMYEIRNRFYADVAYRHKLDKWSFSLRMRFQDQVKRISFNEKEADPSYYWRNKLMVKYSATGKLTPYISAEIFYQLNNPEGNEMDELRLVAGSDYDLDKRNSVSGYFMINKELNVNNPVTSYIIGLEYTYAF